MPHPLWPILPGCPHGTCDKWAHGSGPLPKRCPLVRLWLAATATAGGRGSDMLKPEDCPALLQLHRTTTAPLQLSVSSLSYGNLNHFFSLSFLHLFWSLHVFLGDLCWTNKVKHAVSFFRWAIYTKWNCGKVGNNWVHWHLFVSPPYPHWKGQPITLKQFRFSTLIKILYEIRYTRQTACPRLLIQWKEPTVKEF